MINKKKEQKETKPYSVGDKKVGGFSSRKNQEHYYVESPFPNEKDRLTKYSLMLIPTYLNCFRRLN